MGSVRRHLSLACASLILFGCHKGTFNDRPSGGASAAVLTYPIESKVTTLDPGKVQDVDMGDVLQNVFEGLVTYDENNVLVGRLAERWDVENGGKTYVFHLRDAKFQNGRAVTAEDFRWTWERNLGKPLASPVAPNYLDAIVGVKAFVAGAAKSVTGVEVVDAHTLKVTLDAPRPYFLGNLAYPCASVICKDVAGPNEIHTLAETVGTGPFRFSRIAEDSQLDLEAFEGYWGGKPKVARISRPIVSDASTRLNGYKNGSYDILTLTSADIANVESDPKFKGQLKLEPRPAIAYFSVNQGAYAPFRDERVREAFAMTLDRNHIVNDLLTSKTVANGLVPPGVLGYQPDFKGLPYDPSKARELLSAAGYPGGKGLPPLELTYRSGKPDSRLACEAVATNWRKELTAPVNPKTMEWPALLARRNKGQLQMTFGSWYADYLDPQNFLSLLLTSSSKMNNDSYNDKAFDALCARGDVDQNPTERIDLYRQAERLAVEKAARLPLYFERQPLLVSPRVRGLRKNLFGILPHTTVEVSGS